MIEPIEGIRKVPNAIVNKGRTFIYFIRSGEFVKIGKSRHWKTRMANMQVGSPYTVVPLLVLVGPPDLERKLHNRFKADHFRGEWFHMGPAVSAFIKENLKNCVAKSKTVELPKIEPGRAPWRPVGTISNSHRRPN